MSGHNNCLKCKSFSKSVFNCLEKSVLVKSLTSNSLSISYKKGQDIYVEGASAKGVFCIQEGKAKVYKNCEARSMTISLSGPSDLIGYSGLFNGGSFINSAKCLEDSEICFIPKKNFLNILNASSELQLTLLKQSCHEIQRISNSLKELKCKNMRSRVLTSLLLLYNKFGLDENQCLNISLTRKEIAELSGTTTESVIRIFNDLKREKLITFLNNRIKISELSKLKLAK